jgi:hypothetical protein
VYMIECGDVFVCVGEGKSSRGGGRDESDSRLCGDKRTDTITLIDAAVSYFSNAMPPYHHTIISSYVNITASVDVGQGNTTGSWVKNTSETE